ncbi:MAG: cysteine synthase A [Bacteroidales bacterium]|jgi:cysteine synthase A|nr:cysteine synthase A [Bacteroidales bacterium]MCI2133611.1 cysteine synthase A [Bacteroidales bacterium]
MRIFTNLTELIGNTPLLDVSELLDGSKSRLLLKLELFNPGGSAKDRIALAMIEDAEKRGVLKPGSTIVEPTSGNTGIGLAWVGKAKGYKTILTMPDTMSTERRNLLKAFGAEIILTPGSQGMKGAMAEANKICSETPGAVILGQFTNMANPAAHEKTTGEEIWRDTDGKVDIFIAGIGTGGTVSGTGKALKAHNPKVEIIGLEPASSAVITTGVAGPHKIQGIGAGFVPKTFMSEYVDKVMTVKDEDAFDGARILSRRLGLLVGISSGAAFWLASLIAKKPENDGKTIVALLPDTGERYLSTTLFQ